jgi:hypothetical protein
VAEVSLCDQSWPKGFSTLAQLLKEVNDV